MHKIDSDTAVDGEFTDGDGTVENPATDLNAAWFNSVQRELLAVLSGVGISPDANDDSQIWAALQKISVISADADSGNVNLSGYTGSVVIFHGASNFSVTGGSLGLGKLFVIVPKWTASSPESISVTYGSITVNIGKWNFFLGVTVQGGLVNGVFVPVLNSTVANGELTVGGVVANYVKTVNRYELNLVQFDITDEGDEDTLPEWQQWQLAENWSVGQVKRVQALNIGAGNTVIVFGDTSGGSRSVKFEPYCFREFLCVGTYTNSAGVEFAVLLSNATKM